MPQSNKEIATRWFTEFWHNGNPEIVDELAADDLVFRYPMHGERHGPGQVKAVLVEFKEAFPDMSFDVVGDLVGEGDYVVGRWEGGGTHTGPAFSALPVGSLPANSGKKIYFTGTTVYRVIDGKIAEEIGEEGALTALQQLGVVPQGVSRMASEQSMGEQSMAAPAMQPHMNGGGHLYTQTNEIHNSIIHYLRAADGTLREAERCVTGGAGSGGYNPNSHQESTPNPFEGARSVRLSSDRRFLFATNGGDNSVSSFTLDEEGRLRLADVKRTGQLVPGRSGSAKSLAYDAATGTLYVLHELGPDHLRVLSVDDEGRLTARPEHYTVNVEGKPNRVATTVELSPDGKFLIVGTTFDEAPEPNPDGSPRLWKQRNGSLHLVASNAPDPDGLVVFPVNGDGTLGDPQFQDGGGASPWFPLFLNHRPDQFVLGYAVADGVSLATLDSDGTVTTGPIVQIDRSRGTPSELCWLSISPDDRMVYAANFGYSYVTSFFLEGNVLSVAKDPACPKIPGDGTYRALNKTVSSGTNDNWLTPDGAYLYQLYPNASILIGYRTQPDGSLEEVERVPVPYNSTQGLAGI